MIALVDESEFLLMKQFITYLLDNILNNDIYEIFTDVLECVCFNHIDDGRWKQYMRFILKKIIKQNIKIKQDSLITIMEFINDDYDVVCANGDDNLVIKSMQMFKYFYNIGIYIDYFDDNIYDPSEPYRY
jgi:hypothetical protein